MLASTRGFWARHRREILVSLGVAGVGYAAYRFYDASRAQLMRVQQLRALEEQDAEELVKDQSYGVVSELRDGGYSDDTTLTAIAGQQSEQN